jgi:hypothetical protein
MRPLMTIAAVLFTFAAFADDHANCPMHSQHTASSVDVRGDKVMGFSHETAKHTFKLYADGGAIEVRVLSASDEATLRMVRAHLKHVADAFAKGDFSDPMAVHATDHPDGTDVMRAKKNSIVYRYSDVEDGGSVRLTTSDAGAVDAIHRFMRFQIDEHKTGDVPEVSR